MRNIQSSCLQLEKKASNKNSKFSKKKKQQDNWKLYNQKSVLISSAQHLGLIFEGNELMLIAHEKHHLHELLHESSKNGIGLITGRLSNNGKEKSLF